MLSKVSQKRDKYLLKTYGITLSQYNDILKDQDFVCAVCLKPPKDGVNLCCDHDHVTRKLRGLLHSYCNRYLVGRHRDPEMLRRIADYISQDTGFTVPVKKKKKKRKKKRGRGNRLPW